MKRDRLRMFGRDRDGYYKVIGLSPVKERNFSYNKNHHYEERCPIWCKQMSKPTFRFTFHEHQLNCRGTQHLWTYLPFKLLFQSDINIVKEENDLLHAYVVLQAAINALRRKTDDSLQDCYCSSVGVEGNYNATVDFLKGRTDEHGTIVGLPILDSFWKVLAWMLIMWGFFAGTRLLWGVQSLNLSNKIFFKMALL